MEANKALKLRELVAELRREGDNEGSKSDNPGLPIVTRRIAAGKMLALVDAANRLEAILNSRD